MAGKISFFFGAQDMTHGNPASNLIRFSVPLLIGNLAQQLYSTVDSIVVGQYVGDGAAGRNRRQRPDSQPAARAVHGRFGRREHHGFAVFRREG